MSIRRYLVSKLFELIMLWELFIGVAIQTLHEEQSVTDVVVLEKMVVGVLQEGLEDEGEEVAVGGSVEEEETLEVVAEGVVVEDSEVVDQTDLGEH